MSKNNPSTTTRTVTTLCVYAVLLHTAGVICTTAVPFDTNPTPPLEFPSDELHVKIVQATEKNSNGNNDGETSTISQIEKEIRKQLDDGVYKSHWKPVNVISKISENYTDNFTDNYTENKYYNNRVKDSWSSIALSLIVLAIMAVIVVSFSILCLKKVMNLKVSKQQLLIDDYDDSVMCDLIHIHHV